jgi:hypothetical protein
VSIVVRSTYKVLHRVLSKFQFVQRNITVCSHILYASNSKFMFLCILFGRTGPGVGTASNRNEYQESLKIKIAGGKVRPARRADSLAAIY